MPSSRAQAEGTLTVERVYARGTGITVIMGFLRAVHQAMALLDRWRLIMMTSPQAGVADCARLSIDMKYP